MGDRLRLGASEPFGQGSRRLPRQRRFIDAGRHHRAPEPELGHQLSPPRAAGGQYDSCLNHAFAGSPLDSPYLRHGQAVRGAVLRAGQPRIFSFLDIPSRAGTTAQTQPALTLDRDCSRRQTRLCQIAVFRQRLLQCGMALTEQPLTRSPRSMRRVARRGDQVGSYRRYRLSGPALLRDASRPMAIRIDVRGPHTARTREILTDAQQLAISGIDDCRISRVFYPVRGPDRRGDRVALRHPAGRSGYRTGAIWTRQSYAGDNTADAIARDAG